MPDPIYLSPIQRLVGQDTKDQQESKRPQNAEILSQEVYVTTNYRERDEKKSTKQTKNQQ